MRRAECHARRRDADRGRRRLLRDLQRGHAGPRRWADTRTSAGPAILGGHVDSHNGPAIFYRLGALRSGALVAVSRKDGSIATFSVDRVQRFPKDHFPTALVYGSTNRSELRLITCGGSFDQKSGHYVDNVVAFAHLVA